jgi:hypothetical protein
VLWGDLEGTWQEGRTYGRMAGGGEGEAGVAGGKGITLSKRGGEERGREEVEGWQERTRREQSDAHAHSVVGRHAGRRVR